MKKFSMMGMALIVGLMVSVSLADGAFARTAPNAPNVDNILNNAGIGQCGSITRARTGGGFWAIPVTGGPAIRCADQASCFAACRGVNRQNLCERMACSGVMGDL